MKNLEGGLLEYETAGKFLADIKKEFERGDEEIVKVAELKRLEQEGKPMEELCRSLRGRQEKVDMREDCW